MARGSRLDRGRPDIPWAPAWDRIDDDFEGHLGEIRNFLRCPTVSASDDDMLAGAEYVAALIEGDGGSAEIIPTAGHPSVLGRIEGDGPRLLRYGMLADRVPVIYRGKIVELGPAQTVLTEPLHPYTKSLLAVSPKVGRRRAHEVLTGEPPDPAHIPPGCRFHPRCPVLRSGEAGPQEPRCLGEVPALEEPLPGHRTACHVAMASRRAISSQQEQEAEG